MCLGVPMQVKTIENEVAMCEIDGVQREASLMMLDDVKIGDYVLIHAGFAIEKIDDDEAHHHQHGIVHVVETHISQ